MLTNTSESRADSKPVIEPSQAANVTLRTDVSGSPAPDAHNDRSPQRVGRRAALAGGVSRWFDKGSKEYSKEEISGQYAVDPIRMIPYAALHLMCLGVFWVSWSPVAVAVAGVLYVVHMFSITAFYHRYFSHRTYRTSRLCQFIFAVMGSSCVQRGPIWWAARHRHHHRHSDQEDDIHSPVRHGFYWSHIGWITSKRAFGYDERTVRDLMKFPELRFLDRFDTFVPILEAFALFGLGKLLQAYGYQTTGWQMLIWAFFVSTIICSHATFTINSLTHLWGRKRYDTKDESRNSLLLALLTFGEGWHNNHHRYPGSVRQGFYWWEIDLTHYVLWLMARLGIIWELNAVPVEVRDSHQRN